MKKIYTSYYANIKKLPADMVPIGISVGKNKFFQGQYDLRLAPTWAMMKMDREGYDKAFAEKLSKLDAKEIYDSLPNNAVLLCYEKFNDWCHRRAVAEWLEAELGIEVTEWGLEREECFPYAECCEKNKGVKRELVKEAEGEYMPEAVRKRLESYKKEREVTLFDFEFGEEM
ncbi:hypothetical protein COJ96_10795 [Bacillus sp. AFS073361]|uniref:hypothetical protein n=1 Tax=Bacillus sp. AFS073361 TaxID=2033511 RepID=UPI000BF88E6B|nr:hypothetical protein [Bacillus sp. AFS073361]PFP29383.1 hypothetical protein COJ96_10795 [Bacillus sp. AFS073361]